MPTAPIWDINTSLWMYMFLSWHSLLEPTAAPLLNTVILYVPATTDTTLYTLAHPPVLRPHSTCLPLHALPTCLHLPCQFCLLSMACLHKPPGPHRMYLTHPTAYTMQCHTASTCPSCPHTLHALCTCPTLSECIPAPSDAPPAPSDAPHPFSMYCYHTSQQQALYITMASIIHL